MTSRHATPRARKGVPWRFVAPAAVTLGVVAILAVTARETLTPATPVTVRPVLLEPDAAPDDPGPTTDATDKRPATKTVQAPGWLEPDPFFIACTALADGVVEQMLVLEGQQVREGDVVARLVDDDAELERRRAEAARDAAIAQRELARANVQAAQRDWDEPVERTRAEDAAAAAVAETEAELNQLPALIGAQRAEVERRREEHNRIAQATSTGAASDIERIIAEKTADAAAATLASLEARGPILDARLQRLRAEHVAATRNAELRIPERRALDAATAALARAEADVAAANAHLAEAELRLQRMTITAPITGFVQRRIKAPGDKVMLGMDDPHSAHLVHLYDPEHIQVRVDVPLADAAHIRVGQPCEVIVDVLPNRTFAGEVTRITHEADLQKNTLQAKVRVIDPAPVLKPEMLTRVRFLGSDNAPEDVPQADADATPTLRVLVANDCLTPDGRVFRVIDRRGRGGRVEPVAVNVLETGDEWTAVRADLHPGDLLARTDAALQPGARVRMNAEAGDDS